MLLVDCRVEKAYILARDYEPEHIEGWIASWQAARDAGADIGPGALVMRIEKWGPPPAVSSATPSERDKELLWLERRYERGGRGSLR